MYGDSPAWLEEPFFRKGLRGEQTAKLIRGNGGEAVFVRTDVSDASDVEAAVAAGTNRWGRLTRYVLPNVASPVIVWIRPVP